MGMKRNDCAMNWKRSKISQPILSTIFLLILTLPMAVKTIHLSGSNQHVVCHDHTLHFHESFHECSICDFFFSSDEYLPDVSQQQDLEGFSRTSVKTPATSHRSIDFTSFLLRGPPYIS